MLKLIIILFIFKISFFSTIVKAENYKKFKDFSINEGKNHIVFVPKLYNSIKNDVGNFDNLNIKLSTNKKKDCELFYVKAIYENDYSYVKNISEIIEINKETEELYLNIFQSKILSEEFSFYKFKKRFEKTNENQVRFKGILIHKHDIKCISNIETTKKTISYNFFKKIKRKKQSNKYNEINYKNIEPFLGLKKNIFINKYLKINKNSLSFDSFINRQGEYWSKNQKYNNYYKTKIIKKYDLNLIIDDLFIGEIHNPKNTTYTIICKIKKGAIRILVYNEQDEYINKIMKCSSNEFANFKLKKNKNSKIIVSSYLSDYTYKHLKFSLDLFYN